jgi:hypothetical protein
MRIGYVGDFSQSWHTETHVARDLEALGHDVTRWWLADDRPDLVIAQGNPPGLADIVRDARARGVPTATYHLDVYRGIAREREIGKTPMWWADHVFTADGDPRTQQLTESLNINHHWLPAAVVSDETDPGTWRDEYDHDVVFVGAGRYHREWPWRRQLLDFLARRYGARFRHFDHHPPTRGRDLNDLYATARVVIGDTLALAQTRNYWSDRYYETLGRGGFLIAPWVPGIDAHFTDYEHLRYYTIGDTDGLGALIDTYLAQPDEARAIAKRGNEHVAEQHTYKHRMAALLEAVL